MGLPGYEVKMPRGRRTERGVVKVVAHRVVLGVVPKRRGGAAVEVAHHQPLAFPIVRAAGTADAYGFRELVHQS